MLWAEGVGRAVFEREPAVGTAVEAVQRLEVIQQRQKDTMDSQLFVVR
jgi:hypothetical protein